MQDPQPPTDWTPTRKVYGGSAVGGAIAILIVELCKHAFALDIDDVTQGAIQLLCVFAAGYFIPN